jgi:hypothetical protein
VIVEGLLSKCHRVSKGLQGLIIHYSLPLLKLPKGIAVFHVKINSSPPIHK